MRSALLLLGLSLCVCAPAAAQSIEALLDTYEGINPARLAEEAAPACEGLDTRAFWAILQAIKAEEDRQARLTGSAQISFNGDETNDRALYQVNSYLGLSRGTYPTEIDLTSQIGVTVNNGTFQENVSAVRVNVDYIPRIWLETFFFLHRFSDSFMRVDQRYEVGTGIVLNGWRGLTEPGTRQHDLLNAVSFEATDAALREADWFRCWQAMTGQAEGAALAAARGHAARLEALRDDAKKANRKRNYRFRPALLVGLLTELETPATVTDSALVLRPGGVAKDAFTVTPGAVQSFRWELRPTLDFQFSEVWRLKIRWYVKFPMPWDAYDTVVLRDALGLPRTDPSTGAVLQSRRYDVRTQLDAEFSVRLTERPIFHTGQITMSLRYQRLTDNAPPRAYVSDVLGLDGLPLLIRAEQVHNVVRVGFGLSF